MMGEVGALEQVVNADVERDRAIAITAESRVLNFAMVTVVSGGTNRAPAVSCRFGYSSSSSSTSVVALKIGS
jgi:hypothetical protein